MAQAVNDPHHQQKYYGDTWPSSLITNKAYANAFVCTICNGVPMKCMNDEDGDIFCEGCSKNMENINHVKALQKLVDKLNTKCLSLTQDSNHATADNEDVEGNNFMRTHGVDQSQCEWMGIIANFDTHSKECAFLIIECNHCKSFKCARKLMPKHIDECPEVSINCPLLCGATIIRRNTEHHIANECSEELLECINDDCKMQIKRKDFTQHVNNECDARFVECSYKKYGCNVQNVKAHKLKQHMMDYKVEHLSNKFDFKLAQLTKHVMPKGTIVMWSGRKDNIPDGWLLCDGNNATPDLRNKFVVGASDELKCNSIGGSKAHRHNVRIHAHQLTMDEMPQHNQLTMDGMPYNPWSAFKRSHRMPNHDDDTDDDCFYVEGLEARNKRQMYTQMRTNAYNCKLSSVSLGSNNRHSHGASASNNIHLPPYFAMCFIMKQSSY